MAQPSLEDILAPFDPTLYQYITGAQLLQFLNGAIPFTDKGIVVVTTDIAGNPQVPDAVTNTKWQNYLWVRQLITSTIVYAWNAAAPSDATYLQWLPISTSNIAIGSLNANVLIDHTVTPQQIQSVQQSQVTPSLSASFAPLNQALVGGDLAGNMPAPTIGLGVVTGDTAGNGTGKIAANTLVSNNVKAQGLLPAHDLAGNGTLHTGLRTATITTQMEFFQLSSITDAVNAVVTTTTQFAIPQVATTGASDTGTWQMKTPAQLLAQAQVCFESNTAALVNGSQLINAAHGLASLPRMVRGIVVCTTGELGYSIGDEIGIDGVHGNTNEQAFTVGASATNVFLAQSSAAGFFILHKTTGVQTAATLGNWVAKVYAQI